MKAFKNGFFIFTYALVFYSCKAQPDNAAPESHIKQASSDSPYFSINPATCTFRHEDGRLVLLMELRLERKFDVPVNMEKVAFVLAEDKNGHNSGVFAQGNSTYHDSLFNVFVNGPAGGKVQTVWVLVQRYNNDSIEDVVEKTHKVNLKSVIFTKHDNRNIVYNGNVIYDVENFLTLLDNELAEDAWMLEHAGNNAFALYSVVTMEIPELYMLVKQNRSKFNDKQYARYMHFVEEYGKISSAANARLQALARP